MKSALASALTTPQNLLSLPAEPAHTPPTSRRDGGCEQAAARATAEARASKSRSTQKTARAQKETESFPTSPQADLLGDLNAETWLFNRLREHGVDVYARGLEMTCLRDRIAAAILDNRYGLVVVGRFNGRPENYETAFSRIFGVELKDTPPGKTLHASRAKKVAP